MPAILISYPVNVAQGSPEEAHLFQSDGVDHGIATTALVRHVEDHVSAGAARQRWDEGTA
jgi:hypothetical protein